MSQKFLLFLIPLLLLGAAALAQTAAAEPLPQVQYQTPTADVEGRIVYRVQEGDTCIRIQLLTGVSVETLRELNKLDQNCTIIPGTDLLLTVMVATSTPTPDPDMTPTTQLPTPTSVLGNGNICVKLYNDVNGNAVHEVSEAVMAGGAASISNRSGTISLTATTTDTLEPMCSEVPEGEYNISMGVPKGYNATTLLSQVLSVKAGETAILEFGAQVSGLEEPAPAEAFVPAAPEGSSLLLAVLGGALILMGAGLGGYIVFSRGK